MFDYNNCNHSLQMQEQYVVFDGKEYCPSCFTFFLQENMEIVELWNNEMGIKSGIFKYKKNNTLWQIEGNVCVGMGNCGYVTNYEIHEIITRK